jgi:hypothetical protein
VEWHIVHTITACFLALFGFFMDLQNLMGAIRVLKKGKGPRPLLLLPFALYVLAAFVSDGPMSFKWIAIGIGLVFHIVATVGIRFIGSLRAR